MGRGIHAAGGHASCWAAGSVAHLTKQPPAATAGAAVVPAAPGPPVSRACRAGQLRCGLAAAIAFALGRKVEQRHVTAHAAEKVHARPACRLLQGLRGPLARLARLGGLQHQAELAFDHALRHRKEEGGEGGDEPRVSCTRSSQCVERQAKAPATPRGGRRRLEPKWLRRFEKVGESRRKLEEVRES